ncbi:MAG: hypothetical protein QOI68_28 [Pseudonocardiales bacterium]|nr:hypothetical protein [Pseudonocardiales bacterium]
MFDSMAPPETAPEPYEGDGGASLDPELCPESWSGPPPESELWLEPEPGPYPIWSDYGPDGLLATVLAQVSGGPCGERVERIGSWERVIAWVQAEQIREIAGLARAAEADPAFGDDPEQVYASVCAEVGLMARVASRTARARVDDAVTLAERLPATLAALSSGRISLPSARAVVEETMVLDESLLAEAERRILARAAGRTTGQIRADARRVVARLDAEAVRRRAEQARRERSVRLIPEPDGMATLAAYLPAHEAVAAYGVLDGYARRAGGPGDDRPMDARRADALVDLLLDQLGSSGPVGSGGSVGSGESPGFGEPVVSGGPVGSGESPGFGEPVGSVEPVGSGESPGFGEPVGSGEPLGSTEPVGQGLPPDLAAPPDPVPTVTPNGAARSGGVAGSVVVARPVRRGGVQVRVGVTVGLTTLLGLDQLPGELAGYGPIPADQARELAAQGTWRRLVTDPVTGALLDYGTSRYTPPAHLAAHVVARDQTCVFPGCRIRADRCDLDHRVPFDADGGNGATSDVNLSALCRPHHRLKQQPGWRLARYADGTLAWRTPTGHRYHRRPPPVGPVGEVSDSG